jgi:hypothetical protein
MKKLQAQIEIEATPETVWDTLMDFASYPQWNPFVTSIKGEPTVGSELRATIDPPGGKKATFKPTVTAVEPNSYFEWLGKLGLKGIFDGRHQFRIEPSPSGSTFTQSEEFTGFLAPLLMRFLDKSTRAGFEAMNVAIKDRAEQTAAKGG